MPPRCSPLHAVEATCRSPLSKKFHKQMELSSSISQEQTAVAAAKANIVILQHKISSIWDVLTSRGNQLPPAFQKAAAVAAVGVMSLVLSMRMMLGKLSRFRSRRCRRLYSNPKHNKMTLLTLLLRFNLYPGSQ